MTTTPIDTAHAAMTAAPEDDRARLRFYERLADAELFLLLEAEAQGDAITPALFPVEGQSYALAFDTEERLAEFAGAVAPYAGLSGRALAGLLAGAGLGLALNPDVAPSAWLLDPAAVAWLTETLADGPQETEARIEALTPPGALPEAVIAALDAKLPAAAGLARFAWLAGADYGGGRLGHVLAFVDAAPGAERALAGAVSEALVFSGIEAGEIDVAFFRASDPIAARLAKVGLRFDLPEPEAMPGPSAPGMDPDRPPKLK